MLHISRNKRYLLYRRCSFGLFALSARTSCNAHKKPPRIPSRDPKISTIIVSPSLAMDRACGAPSDVPNNISDKNGAPAFMCRRCAVSGVTHAKRNFLTMSLSSSAMWESWLAAAAISSIVADCSSPAAETLCVSLASWSATFSISLTASTI